MQSLLANSTQPSIRASGQCQWAFDYLGIRSSLCQIFRHGYESNPANLVRPIQPGQCSPANPARSIEASQSNPANPMQSIPAIYPGIWLSRHPAIWAFGYLSIWPSGHLTIWAFYYLDIWLSGHLVIWASGYLGVWLSEHLAIWVSGYQGNWISGTQILGWCSDNSL